MFGTIGDIDPDLSLRVPLPAVARSGTVSRAIDQLLPLPPCLAPLFPAGALQRGSIVAVDASVAAPPTSSPERAGGTTTLAFALLTGLPRGSWQAAVGLAQPGLVALGELGVDLEHLLIVPNPGRRWAEVAAVLLEGTDVVVLCPPSPPRPAVVRRLCARARERRAVLVVLAGRWGWPDGPDVRLSVGPGRWVGVGQGEGHLRGRLASVRALGRRAASREVGAHLWLPGPSGAVAPASPAPEEG